MTFYTTDPDSKNLKNYSVADPNANPIATTLVGSEVENLYASSKGGMVYIADNKSKRFTVFKAFLKNFSLSVKPKINLEHNLFTLNPFISSGQTLYTYDFTLDVPAFNTSEGHNNLAKLQELFRYIATLNSAAGDSKQLDQARRSTVYFSNLISKGESDVVFPLDGTFPINLILENGISGVIKNIEYKPTIPSGFYETTGDQPSTGYLPKHFELNIQLFMVTPHSELGSAWPFMMDIK